MRYVLVKCLLQILLPVAFGGNFGSCAGAANLGATAPLATSCLVASKTSHCRRFPIQFGPHDEIV